jgi:hypothetical protein
MQHTPIKGPKVPVGPPGSCRVGASRNSRIYGQSPKLVTCRSLGTRHPPASSAALPPKGRNSRRFSPARTSDFNPRFGPKWEARLNNQKGQ